MHRRLSVLTGLVFFLAFSIPVEAVGMVEGEIKSDGFSLKDRADRRNAIMDQEFQRLAKEMAVDKDPQETPVDREQKKSRDTITDAERSRTLRFHSGFDPERKSKDRRVDQELNRINKEFQTEPQIPSEENTLEEDSSQAPPRFLGGGSDQEILNKAQYSVGGGTPPTMVTREGEKSYYHHKGTDFETNLQLGFGYRVDDFDWNIAGDSSGKNPNVLSELTWRDLKSYELKAKGNWVFHDKYVLDGSVASSEIFRGDVQDSDYAGNNRTSETSRSNNRSDDGSLYDLSAGLGYRMYLNEDHELWVVDDLWLTLLAGYSYHSQDLRITDGVQTIPATGPFAGLNSKYEAEWQGPWVGAELMGTRKRLNGFLRFEYHFLVDYYAQADWNLRSDFQHPKSFEHEAEGTGLVVGLGGGWALNDNWSLNANIDIYDFKTREGIDRTFFSNGTTSETRLNEVNWSNWAAMLAVTYRFGHEAQ